MEWVSIYYDMAFPNINICIVVRMMVYSSHFISNLTSLCIIASMCVHRYNRFKEQDVDGLNKHTYKYITSAIFISIVSLFPIMWEIWLFFEEKTSQNECIVSRVQQPMECKFFYQPCSTFITVVIVTILITASSVATNISNVNE